MKTSVNIKMEPEVRDSAKALFSELGLDMTTAINLFLRTAVKEQAIPFPIAASTSQKAEERFKSLILADIKQSEKEIEQGKAMTLDAAFKGLESKYGVRH